MPGRVLLKSRAWPSPAVCASEDFPGRGLDGGAAGEASREATGCEQAFTGEGGVLRRTYFTLRIPGEE